MCDEGMWDWRGRAGEDGERNEGDVERRKESKARCGAFESAERIIGEPARTDCGKMAPVRRALVRRMCASELGWA